MHDIYICSFIVPTSIDKEDLHFKRTPYALFPSYYQSKLCNVYFAMELKERAKSILRRARMENQTASQRGKKPLVRGIDVFLVHPGLKKNVIRLPFNHDVFNSIY